MEYQISNEYLQVTISSKGAEMTSLRSNGVDYLWSGEEAYWDEQSPLLFPFVGRLTDEKYFLEGKEQAMGIHGFAKHQEFQMVCEEDAYITLELRDNDDTYKQYPYHFILQVTYELQGYSVQITYRVVNESERKMFFGIGGHPGFRVPLEEGLSFSDYYLEFDSCCRPSRVGHTEACFLSGIDKELQLEEGKKIPLFHEMFDDDAIVLREVADAVTLKSDKGSRKVKVSYPDLPFLGIWHKPMSDAPYVCIEPWTSLPSRQGIIEEFAYKSDLIRLQPQQQYVNSWSITIE